METSYYQGLSTVTVLGASAKSLDGYPGVRRFAAGVAKTGMYVSPN
jgi:hypothetical protein